MPPPEPVNDTAPPRREHDRDPDADVPEPGSPPPTVEDRVPAEPTPQAASEPDLPPEPATTLDPSQTAIATTPHRDASTRGDLAAVLGAVAAPARPPTEIEAVLDAFGTRVSVHDAGIATLAAAVDVGAITRVDPTLAAVSLTLSIAFGAPDALSLGTLFGTG